MKFVIGLVVSFLVGAGCRYFDIPVGSPPVLPGALLVLAMTLGYTSTDRLLTSKGRIATTKYACGGPTGMPASISAPNIGQNVADARREQAAVAPPST